MPNNVNEEREEQPDEAPANEHALGIPDPKVANFDLTYILRKETLWAGYELATRQYYYSLLPDPSPGQPPQNVNVNPMHTPLRQSIEIAWSVWRAWRLSLKTAKRIEKWLQIVGVVRGNAGLMDWPVQNTVGEGSGGGDEEARQAVLDRRTHRLTDDSNY